MNCSHCGKAINAHTRECPHFVWSKHSYEAHQARMAPPVPDMGLREVEREFAVIGKGVLHATTTIGGQTCASWHVPGSPIHVYVGETLLDAFASLLAEVRMKKATVAA